MAKNTRIKYNVYNVRSYVHTSDKLLYRTTKTTMSRRNKLEVAQFAASIDTNTINYKFYQIAGIAPGTVYPRATSRSSITRNSAGEWEWPAWEDLYTRAPWVPLPSPMHNNTYDTSFAFSQMMDSMTPKDSVQTGQDEFEATDNSEAFAGQPGGFGQAYFPVVYRMSPSYVRTQGLIENEVLMIDVIPFRVVASAVPYRSPSYNPNYIHIQTPGYDVQSGNQVTVNIYLDNTWMADDGNAYAAAIGAVRSLIPSRWLIIDGKTDVFLTIAPAISRADYIEHGERCRQSLQDNNLTNDQCFLFEGASLGLACMAAVMGAPPFMYTGYNSQIGTDAILVDDPQNPIQRVVLGANLVERIDDVEWKVACAVYTGVPIIIPLNVSWYTEPMQMAIYRGLQRALRTPEGKDTMLALAAKRYGYAPNKTREIAQKSTEINWISQIRDLVYTTAKREAGQGFDVLPSLVAAAVNISDVQILSAMIAAYIWNPGNATMFSYRQQYGDGTLAGGMNLINTTRGLAQARSAVQRAEELAKHHGAKINLKKTEDKIANRKMDYEVDPWDLEFIKVPVGTMKPKGRSAGKVTKKKPASKKAVGGAAGKRRKKSAGKKKATKRKSSAKKKKKKAVDGEAAPKRKKRKTKGKKSKAKKSKGKKKKASKKSKKKKGGKKKTKKTKKRKSTKLKYPGYAGGHIVTVKSGAAKGKYPMSARIGRQIPLLGLPNKALESFMDEVPSARSALYRAPPTAKRAARERIKAREDGGTRNKPLYFS